MDIDKNEVKMLAEVVRLATIEVLKTPSFKYYDAIEFPYGLCGVMSRTLGVILKEKYPNVAIEYVCGERNGQSHAWIELKQYIVDITCEQFDEINESVCVCFTSGSKFHLSFKNQIRRKITNEDCQFYEEQIVYQRAKYLMYCMEQKYENRKK